MIVVRLDSALYNAAVIDADRRNGARFSVAVPVNASIRAAIAAIGEDAWTTIKYPRAIWDDQLGAWISGDEIAEKQYTAFASRKCQAVTARLIVRRVHDRNKAGRNRAGRAVPRLALPCHLHNSPFELIQAEGQHRDHAVVEEVFVEQVFADVTNGPPAHLPRGFRRERGLAVDRGHGAQPPSRRRGLASPAFAKADHPP
jgi:hypothetical protein